MEGLRRYTLLKTLGSLSPQSLHSSLKISSSTPCSACNTHFLPCCGTTSLKDYIECAVCVPSHRFGCRGRFCVPNQGTTVPNLGYTSRTPNVVGDEGSHRTMIFSRGPSARVFRNGCGNVFRCVISHMKGKSCLIKCNILSRQE